MWLRYNFSKEKSLSHQSAIASPPVTTILLHHYTITPVHNPTLTTHYYTTILLHHYTITPVYLSPVYQFTGSPLTTHLSPLTTKPLHYYTTIRLHHSLLTYHHYTTHDTYHFEPACVPWKAGDFR